MLELVIHWHTSVARDTASHYTELGWVGLDDFELDCSHVTTDKSKYRLCERRYAGGAVSDSVLLRVRYAYYPRGNKV
jgi:hypothetical protein